MTAPGIFPFEISSLIIVSILLRCPMSNSSFFALALNGKIKSIIKILNNIINSLDDVSGMIPESCFLQDVYIFR